MNEQTRCGTYIQWNTCCCSAAKLCPTLCDPMDCSTPGFPVFRYLPVCSIKFMSIELVMPSNHVNLCPHFSFCLSSFPASGSFLVSELFESSSQSIGTSASALVLPVNIQGWFPLALTGFISLLSKELLKSLPQHHNAKASISSSTFSFLYGPILTSVHDYWKNHSFDCMDLCWQSEVSAF